MGNFTFKKNPCLFLIIIFTVLVQVWGHNTETSSSSTKEPPIEASTCPDDLDIFPCTCTLDLNRKVNIECTGSSVNQGNIEHVFAEIRLINEIPQDRGIQIFGFELRETKLTQVDMAPFYGNQIDSLNIRENYALSKLVTSGNPQDYRSIHVNRFVLQSIPINREGLGDIFKYFPNEMTTFDAEDISLYGDNISGEFLPGFSTLTNLKYLWLRQCNISGRLDSDTLLPKELRNLELIDLWNNNINEIGENVFHFYDSVDYLRIDLYNNKLNESSFHPNSGISQAGRETRLELEFNQITTLPAPIFETFLDAHPQNTVALDENPLICDERLSWIKSRRFELSSKVSRAYCSNDAGHDVFDSDLIPHLKKNNIFNK